MNFPTRAQFTADLASVSPEVRWTELDYYWLAEVSPPDNRGQLSVGRCPCWPGC
jgi:hypothetical protein